MKPTFSQIPTVEFVDVTKRFSEKATDYGRRLFLTSTMMGIWIVEETGV
jgi:hypothetical protein